MPLGKRCSAVSRERTATNDCSLGPTREFVGLEQTPPDVRIDAARDVVAENLAPGGNLAAVLVVVVVVVVVVVRRFARQIDPSVKNLLERRQGIDVVTSGFLSREKGSRFGRALHPPVYLVQIAHEKK